MYKRCQTESSAQRQRELERSLLQVMLKKQYDEITVSDLCQEIEVPRKSFYRYFSGKDGALYAMIDHALMDYDMYTAYPRTSNNVTPMDYMEGVFRYWVQHKELLDALHKSGLTGVLVQRALEYSNEMDTIPRFLQISDRRLREYGTMFMVCGLMTMIVQWHHDGFAKSPGEMALLAMELLTKPLFSGKLEDI